MVFVFPNDVTYSFTMDGVSMPLSIAWFDGWGRLVDTADMAACASGRCDRQYGARSAYRYAVEVPLGDLSRLGVSPRRMLVVGGRCGS